jgi:hypothetical protein
VVEGIVPGNRGVVPRRFIAFVPISERERSGGLAVPLWDLGARVAPLRCPILRPGQRWLYRIVFRRATRRLASRGEIPVALV